MRLTTVPALGSRLARGLPLLRRAGLLGALALAGACGQRESGASAAAAPPASAPTPPAAPLSVAAASSLRELLEGTQARFEAHHAGAKLGFSFDASSTLSRQIEEGAPFDVFLSADGATVDRIASSVRAASRRDILGNRLVLVGRADLAAPPQQPADLRGSALSIAVAGPAVPAGRYARACLEKLGLLAALEPRLVNGDSVKATLALVENGAADCGLVYLTDARAAKSARLLWTAPPEADPGIVYVAVALQRASSPLADAYLEWLGGQEFLDAAQALGFLPPPAR